MNLNSNGEMASGELFLTSRSAVECYQHCHRKRLINYHIGEGHLGIVPAYRDWETDRKSTRLNSSHITRARMPSSA